MCSVVWRDIGVPDNKIVTKKVVDLGLHQFLVSKISTSIRLNRSLGLRHEGLLHWADYLRAMIPILACLFDLLDDLITLSLGLVLL